MSARPDLERHLHALSFVAESLRIAMHPPTAKSCSVVECAAQVPPSLVRESLCLDHYLEAGLARVRELLDGCREARPLDPRLLEWLFASTEFAVQTLTQDNPAHTPEQRERLLELLLCLTNLQEYLRHHSVKIPQPE